MTNISLAAWLLLAATKPLNPDIWVQPAVLPAPPGDAPEIAWNEAEPSAWHHAPTAHVHGGADDPNAVIWVAMTQRHLHLHVLVMDNHHVNDESGDAIWNGDALGVSIDPRGDAKTLPRQAALAVQRGGLSATFALTRHGIRGWAHTRAAPDATGPLTTRSRIERDAARNTTTYDVVLPWDLLHTTPGESATLGLQVEINDRDASGTMRRARFGDSPPGTFDATRFKTLRLGAPAGQVLMLAPRRLNVWRSVDAACAMVITNQAASLSADIGFADTQRTLRWMSHGAGLRRWNVCVAPRHLLEAPVAWSLAVAAAGAPLTARGSYVVKSPSPAVEADLAAIAALAMSAPQGLARRHLAATHALLQSAWAAASATLEDGDAAAEEAAASIAESRSRLPPRIETLEHALQAGDRPMLGVFVSSEDQTLQPYTLTLPRAIDANETQAVTVFLHGRGTPSLPGFVAQAQATHMTSWGRAYLLHPWGRGNIDFRGFAEADVLDALDHADSLFHFDHERTWLAGFSMGGAGAWRVAMHHPDRWAAVAIFAGRPGGVPMGMSFGSNLAHLPVYLHHGSADGDTAVEGTRAMQDELERNGGKPVVIYEEGGRHAMTEQHRRDLEAWTAEQVRPRPKVVHYSSDTPGQTAYGITLHHDRKLATFPRYVVHVSDRQLRIDTVGTTGLDVDLAEPTWGFTDICRVSWNGTQVYDGPLKTLHLGVN